MKHLFLNVIFYAMNCLVIALHQTHSKLFFVQNQYFVTVAKAESASDAFLEREREIWLWREEIKPVSRARAAWREQSRAG